jgi:hypothetical protein
MFLMLIIKVFLYHIVWIQNNDLALTYSGGRRIIGSSWLSISQGIAEDTSGLVSGFSTLSDDSLEYPIGEH